MELSVDGAPVMTVRWLPPVTWYVGPAGLTHGEALVHSGVAIPVDAVLLAGFAFDTFTSICSPIPVS
jgi:hypothetical protein